MATLIPAASTISPEIAMTINPNRTLFKLRISVLSTRR